MMISFFLSVVFPENEATFSPPMMMMMMMMMMMKTVERLASPSSVYLYYCQQHPREEEEEEEEEEETKDMQNFLFFQRSILCVLSFYDLAFSNRLCIARARSSFWF